MPPSYNSREYWNGRFTSETSFDWLLPTPDALNLINDQFHCRHPPKEAKVLHIGCGNSALSHQLPNFIGPGGRVTNVDFSETAIKAARAKAASDQSRQQAQWIAADLLSLDYIETKLLHGSENDRTTSYDLIVDKSTSDSIACGSDIAIDLPYAIQERHQRNDEPFSPTLSQDIHPIHILALHLAVLTRPQSKWLVLSYSEHRFPFLETQLESGMYEGLSDAPLSLEIIEGGFPDTSKLWRMERKWAIETTKDQSYGEGEEMVYRPPELCWVYVLVRTDVEVSSR